VKQCLECKDHLSTTCQSACLKSNVDLCLYPSIYNAASTTYKTPDNHRTCIYTPFFDVLNMILLMTNMMNFGVTLLSVSSAIPAWLNDDVLHDIARFLPNICFVHICVLDSDKFLMFYRSSKYTELTSRQCYKTLSSMITSNSYSIWHWNKQSREIFDRFTLPSHVYEFNLHPRCYFSAANIFVDIAKRTPIYVNEGTMTTTIVNNSRLIDTKIADIVRCILDGSIDGRCYCCSLVVRKFTRTKSNNITIIELNQ
jgi:hypothetical protein